MDVYGYQPEHDTDSPFLFVIAHGACELLLSDKEKSKTMKQFLKELADRATSKTPIFFKKVGNIGMSIAASGGAIIAPEVVGAHMPDTLVKIGGHLLTAGAIMKAVAHLACTNPPDPK